MNHLLRELAPVSGEAWGAIDEEAARTLRHFLAARKVVDFSGPHGWAHSAETLGRVETVGAAPAGVDAAIRRMQPLAELRTPFELSRRELEAIDRGSRDYDLQVVIDAARQAASAEDAAVFHGYDAAGISGISESTPHAPVAISDDYNEYPGTVRARRRHAPDRRHRGTVRDRARASLLHGRHRDDRARRVPGARAHPPDPGWTDRVGAGGGRRDRREPAWR